MDKIVEVSNGYRILNPVTLDDIKNKINEIVEWINEREKTVKIHFKGIGKSTGLESIYECPRCEGRKRDPDPLMRAIGDTKDPICRLCNGKGFVVNMD